MKKIILLLIVLSSVAFSSGSSEVIKNKSGDSNVKSSYWERTTKNNIDNYVHYERFTDSEFKEMGRIIYDINYESKINTVTLIAYKSTHLLEKGVKEGKTDVVILDIDYGQMIKADVKDEGSFYTVRFGFDAKDFGCDIMMELLSNSIINLSGKDSKGHLFQLTYILENPINEYKNSK